MTVRTRVWFHRASGAAWAVFGVLSVFLGLANSVALVWFASVYANVKSDWGAAEAADDRKVIERLEAIEAVQREILAALRKD